MEINRKRSTFIPLYQLEVYQLSRELSKIGWEIYNNLEWQDKKIMGDQFIEATDSTGANIAEGYFRYHFLDRVRFYYQSRASLAESAFHWLELLLEHKKVKESAYRQYKTVSDKLSLKLNNFIASTAESRIKSRKDDSSQ